VAGDSTPPDLIEFGVVIFQPGDVEVPLLLPAEVVRELQSLDFGNDSARAGASDSSPGIAVPNADSIRAAVASQLKLADSVRSSASRFADSVRAEARKRIAEDADQE
jgi:hypothetical protein